MKLSKALDIAHELLEELQTDMSDVSYRVGNYAISIGAYDKVRQLVVYQNVIFAYQESDRDAKTESLGNGYYSKVYTEKDKRFAEQQIRELLKNG